MHIAYAVLFTSWHAVLINVVTITCIAPARCGCGAMGHGAALTGICRHAQLSGSHVRCTWLRPLQPAGLYVVRKTRFGGIFVIWVGQCTGHCSFPLCSSTASWIEPVAAPAMAKGLNPPLNLVRYFPHLNLTERFRVVLYALHARTYKKLRLSVQSTAPSTDSLYTY